jgi:hypothetical protein
MIENEQGLKTMIQRVKLLSERYPEVKGNYVLLYQRYIWYFEGLRWFVDWEKLKTTSSPESVARAFRKAVEKGFILPTEKMKERRRKREEKIRNVMKSDKELNS